MDMRAPGSWTRSSDLALEGRDGEVVRLRGLLESARSGAASGVLLTGDAGQGKTTLLAAMADDARQQGFRVLWTAGHEFERSLAFAGLSGVLRPVLAFRAALPAAQAASLEGALGIGLQPAAPLSVCIATLALVARVSEESPVLLVVDDAHWLDRSSLSVIMFVAHRVEAERISMVFASRPGESELLAQSRLDRLELRDLKDGDARRLLESKGATPAVARRCWELAGGNPLALLDGYASLTDDQRDERAALPPVLAMGDNLLASFARRLDRLPPATAAALEVAVLDTTGEMGAVIRAVKHTGAELDDLLVAETFGLIHATGNDIRWSHPLLRAAVHHRSSPQTVRAAHQALAATARGLSEERRLWHVSESIVGPDERVAADLDAIARVAAQRGSLPAAADTYLQAARLSPDRAAAQRRRLRAGRHWWGAGEHDITIEHLRPLLEEATDVGFAAEVVETLGQAELWVSGSAGARQLLEHYAGAVRATDPRLSAVLGMHAAMANLVCLDADRAAAVLDVAHRSIDGSGDGDLAMAAAAMQLIVSTFVAPPETADHGNALELVLRSALAALEAETDGAESIAQLCAYALVILDRQDTAGRALDQIVQFGTRSGLVGLGLFARIVRTEARWRAGRWSEALADISQTISLQEATGLRALAPCTMAMAARVEAGLGRADDCQAHANAAIAVSAARGLDLVLAWAYSALGLLHLGAGRYGQAAEVLEHVASLAGHLRQPGWLWWQADLVEALHGAGRVGAARVALRNLETNTSGAEPTWADGAVRRGRALLGVGDAETDYGAALEAFAAVGASFEQGRTLYLRGRHRLRAGGRATVEGYRDLADARSTFDRLGARDWSDRASSNRGEEASTGATLADRLSPAELRVALSVSSGHTNAQAAEELFLAEKTVDFHLGNIYRKLGLRNRAQLAGLVAAERATRVPAQAPTT